MVEEMKKHTKLPLILKIVLMISLATSCWNRPFISPDKEGYDRSKELLSYLENDDAEGLKSMFCEITRESPTIDEEIEAALAFFEGKIISRDKESTPCEESVRNGEIVYLEIAPDIDNIKTDKEQIYRVKFYVQVVNAKSPEKEGVSEIVITNAEGEECVVGEFLDV